MRKQTALVDDFASWIVIEVHWQDNAFFVSICHTTTKNNVKNTQNRTRFTIIMLFLLVVIKFICIFVAKLR
jgi:hypothetical protein